MSTPTPTTSAADWLAAADPDPRRAKQWLGHAGVALLPSGVRWDAIRIEPPLAEHVIASGITGPVISAPDACYALVPVGTPWDPVPGTEALRDTAYVAVPAPDRVCGPGVYDIYWAQPPDGAGRLVDPGRLAEVIAAQRGGVRR